MNYDRYSPGAYGGMCRNDDGAYIHVNDVQDLLETLFGVKEGCAIFKQNFIAEEICDDANS